MGLSALRVDQNGFREVYRLSLRAKTSPVHKSPPVETIRKPAIYKDFC